MKTISKILTLLVAVIFYTTILAKAYAPQKADTVKAALSRINKQYSDAFSKGDSSLFLDCYAADACIMAANTPILCEKAGMLLFYKAAYKMGIRKVIFTTVDLYGQTADFVTEQGTYDMQNESGLSIGKGKYLVIWKKVISGWKMFRDMFNSNSPMVHVTK